MTSITLERFRLVFLEITESTMDVNVHETEGLKDDIEASEGTALLDASPAPSEEAVPSEQRLWEELAQPWPATFERSISLLASPVISAKAADHFTKSPKPGNTPIAARRLEVRISIHMLRRPLYSQLSVILIIGLFLSQQSGALKLRKRCCLRWFATNQLTPDFRKETKNFSH